MLKTLRNRLILSHAIPFLVLLPIMGVALIYTLETQYLVPGLTRNLEADARLIADLARGQPGIWQDPRLAQDLVSRLSPGQGQSILLVTPAGALLASTRPEDEIVFSTSIEPADLERLAAGEVVDHKRYGSSLQNDLIDVTAPVMSDDGRLVGLVRLTYHYATFYEELSQLRYLIGIILFIGLLVGVILGSALAINIERPIQDVTRAVYELANGRRSGPLAERGPEEVRQLQRAANHLVEQLHSLEESRRKLLANLVHELGRPLGSLRSATQALLRGAKNDPQLLQELLEGMDDETERMQRLTDELSQLHDQLLGTLKLDLRPVALGEWLPRVLRPWQAVAQDRRLRWSEDVPASLPEIQADPDRLAQIVGNLLSNAVKYTPAGGMVAVDAGLEGSQVWIRVYDTGPGIPAEEQERIFTPFFRGSQGRRFPQGMGLGLGIANELATAHRGRLELESAPGAGSKFTLWLPVN